jgi:hypothetical protein
MRVGEGVRKRLLPALLFCGDHLLAAAQSSEPHHMRQCARPWNLGPGWRINGRLRLVTLMESPKQEIP